LTDFDIIAREISGDRTRFEAIEKRLDEVEKVNALLEDAALTPRGGQMQGWLRVDREHLRTKWELATWVEGGAAFARSLPAKR
jgi:hypothetical protein